MHARTDESPRDRIVLAREAGLGRLSFASVLCGALVAYGAFTVLAAIAGGVLAAIGFDVDSLSRSEWRQVGVGGAIAVAAVLLLSYMFGGYCAGRMARRGGAANGFMVFMLSAFLAAAVALALGARADTDAIADDARGLGMPTAMADWSVIGTIAGAAALAAMLIGALMGGTLGERWHGKMARRAADPRFGYAVADGVRIRRDDRAIDLRRAERSAAAPDTDRVNEPEIVEREMAERNPRS